MTIGKGIKKCKKPYTDIFSEFCFQKTKCALCPVNGLMCSAEFKEIVFTGGVVLFVVDEEEI